MYAVSPFIHLAVVALTDSPGDERLCPLAREPSRRAWERSGCAILGLELRLERRWEWDGAASMLAIVAIGMVMVVVVESRGGARLSALAACLPACPASEESEWNAAI